MSTEPLHERPTILDRIIRFCLENKLVVFLVLIFIIVWGVRVAPFDWDTGAFPRDPVPVDAIPDIGENQQIVFTEWMGRSPKDVDDQITYPLTVALMGVPEVKTVRSYSMFGFSSIYVIFKEGVDFYWSRSRVLEKLNSLSSGALPEGVQPTLGPDATALGQVFWYTLEGQDAEGHPTGGWDLQELRSIQDWTVRYALLSADGVSEVASVGGFVKEYQVDVDPDAMRAYGVTLDQVFAAVKGSNVDVGARTIEINRVEYVIRGLGFIKTVADVEDTVVAVHDNVPVYVRQIAHVALGPALRRGALDKEGAEVVGGVVVVRYAGNPLATIKNVKKKITEITPGLPKKVLIDRRAVTREQLRSFAGDNALALGEDGLPLNEALVSWAEATSRERRPAWMTLSQVRVNPFYDRTGLINETLGTLDSALTEEILVTIIVILVMVMHLRSSVLISTVLPAAVLMCFIAMRYFGVDANVVALSGIAIAIGTMVDMGIIICENILKHLDEAKEDESRLEVVYRAASEVGGAIVTAISTTVVSFLPVFTMEAAEGKLFKPLAYTKTFALIASVVVALVVIPAFAQILFTSKINTRWIRRAFHGSVVFGGIALAVFVVWWAGLLVALIGLYHLTREFIPERAAKYVPWVSTGIAVLTVLILLSDHWMPLGPERGLFRNVLFAGFIVGGILGFFSLFQWAYAPLLKWFLRHKLVFLAAPGALLVLGVFVWRGLGKEFMPPLDEGSYLYMPTTMPHASIGEALDVLQKQDVAIRGIPEIESVVGKIGRAETPLDPAPVSMIETIVNYKPEFIVDSHGGRLTFRYDADGTELYKDQRGAPVKAPDGKPYLVRGRFIRDAGELVPDPRGKPFRLWRPALDAALNPDREPWGGIRKPDDIWKEIAAAGNIPGSTSAPRLQPIAARIVMLQSGMRAPMGIKVKGPDLDSIERFGFELEQVLKQVPSVEPSAVIADHIVGKPYLEIAIDRKAAARFGISVRRMQDAIETAIGGKRITTTVEGRERYPVRVRYLRELRDSIETLGRILVPAPNGTQIPLEQLAEITYVRGPQVIKSEDTRLIGYVLFDMKPGHAEVDVVEDADALIKAKIASGELAVPAGVEYTFAGSYENQLRSERRLMMVLPLALFVIFLILYFQFRSAITTFIVFSGILVAWAGGFIMIWLYGQPWFLDFSLFGVDMRELFQVHTVNLSVAVWVGFLALFGIASDDGVVMATYLDHSYRERKPQTVDQIREATLFAGMRRIRPCLMTTATTIIALIPVLTSTGRGADVMVPMAIPAFGGMVFEVITLFVVPVLYSLVAEIKMKLRGSW